MGSPSDHSSSEETDSENEEIEPPAKRRKLSSLDILEAELKRYIPKIPREPALFLAESGYDSVVRFLRNQTLICKSPIFQNEFFALLLRSQVGNYIPFRVLSFKLQLPQKIKKCVLIEVDGLSKQDVFAVNSELNTNPKMFNFIFEIVSSNAPLATELSTLHMTSTFYQYANEYYSSLFPIDKTIHIAEDLPSKPHLLNKLHLLLTPVQLAMEKYPLPINYYQLSQSVNYIFTKDLYSPVTVNSPMFALDCEMVKVAAGGREVARISVVNEDLEVVYTTLVQPEREILCYLTEYSGITEEMLKGVTVRLADVQQELRKILPPDAILCGQSLNFDLHALQMIHPYVIDTSNIYQSCRLPRKKKSLKRLTKIFLNEDIQTTDQGHDPNEDAIATMKLIQLRLKTSVLFNKDTPFFKKYPPMEPPESTCEVNDFSNFARLGLTPNNDGFFPRLSRASKRVCLIGSAENLDKYYSGAITENVTKIVAQNLFELTTSVTSNISHYDVILSHIKYEKQNCSLKELIGSVKEIHDKLPKHSIFYKYISGVGNTEDMNIKHNLCMTKVTK